MPRTERLNEHPGSTFPDQQWQTLKINSIKKTEGRSRRIKREWRMKRLREHSVSEEQFPLSERHKSKIREDKAKNAEKGIHWY